jgi:hypothetical protein
LDSDKHTLLSIGSSPIIKKLEGITLLVLKAKKTFFTFLWTSSESGRSKVKEDHAYRQAF